MREVKRTQSIKMKSMNDQYVFRKTSFKKILKRKGRVATLICFVAKEVNCRTVFIVSQVFNQEKEIHQ